MSISPKATGATSGSVLGGALTIIGLWIFGLVEPKIVVPDEVASALTLIVGSVLAFVGAYVPHSVYIPAAPGPPNPPPPPQQGA